MPLIDTLRELTASEDDNYFQDSTLVFYLNSGQRTVASLLSQREKAGESFRALDSLRETDTNVLTGFSADGDHFVGTQQAPSSFLDWLYLDYEGIPLLELPVSKQYLLKWGNHDPSEDEGYFSLVQASSNVAFKCFLHEQPDGTTDSLNVQYLKVPTDVTDASTEFPDLPEALTSAVLYKAASLMATQEGRESTQEFDNRFKQELNSSLF